MNDRTWVWDAIGIGSLVALCTVAAYAYFTLHGSVITGIAGGGTIRYGDKSALFILPIAGISL